MSRRTGARLLLILLGAALVATGYWLLFSAFLPYDDEGYVLQTLRDYCAHGGLYDRVYSQYGPAFYLIYDFLHRMLGFAFNNMTGRELTLFNWVTTVVACAGITWRFTRSGAAAVLVMGASFYHLWDMICEPGHPGSMLAVILATGTWAGIELIRREKIVAFALVAGATAALLALIKINIGVFYIAASGAWLLVNFRPPRAARAGAMLCAILLVLMPPLLMSHFLRDEWALLFALLASTAAGTMIAAVWQARRPAAGWKELGIFLGAGLGVTLAVTALIVVRGTGLHALLDGVLIDPMRHPGIYHFAPRWRPGAVVVVLASLLLAAACWRWRQSPRLPGLLAAARLLLGLVFFLSYLEILPLNTLIFVLQFGLPLAWLLVFPLEPGSSGPEVSAKAWLGLVLTEQYLHAYPIAGSQIAWGTFLFIPLVAIGAWESVVHFARSGRRWIPNLRFAGAALVCAGTFFMTGSLARLGATRYLEGEPLGLPGAENLRLTASLTSTLRMLTENAVAQGDMLFSLPGLYSFNGWTRLPPPTEANVTHWFSLLDDAQQADIATALEHARRPVIVVERGLLDFLRQGDIPIRGPLFDFIQGHFIRVFSLENYEFWIRRGRRIAPVSQAELLVSRAPIAGRPHWRINATVLPGRPVVAMELMHLGDTATPLAHFSAVNATLAATPIRLDGGFTGPTITQAWGKKLPALVRLTLDLKDPLPPFDERSAVLYLLDDKGSRVAQARFTN